MSKRAGPGWRAESHTPGSRSLDCHFESICESFTYFVTTVEFRPTLKAQRDDAEAKGQVGKVKVFDGLLSRREPEAS